MLYYPTEKWLSKITDVLITINQEDYTRAKNEFFARKVMYVPGIGVDTKKFSKCAIDRIKKREELNIQQDAFILLSVGELSERKNQKIVIEAIYHIKKTGNIDHLVYLIIGQGELKNDFEKLIDLYDLNAHVKLLGYRNDIDELCKTVDCFVHPSIREGFGIAPMEAMAAGLPLISADINGIRDYTEEGKTGCCVNPCSIQEMIRAIEKMRQNIEFRKTCGWHNAEIAKKFDVSKANEVMKNVYRDVVI
jgi:glycosyltransferase involved in cell wall biosynthesis